MSAGFNLRDLGGHPVASGGRVRRGAVYRAASVHRFGGDGLPPIRTLIDLRSPSELASEGECPPFHGATVLHHPVLTALWTVPVPDAPEEIAAFLAERYLEMLTVGGAAIAGVIAALAREDRLPAVFFCAAGKDRTGVVAAVLLSLLGVADEAIAADYALSQEPVQTMAERLRRRGDAAGSAMVRASASLLVAPQAAMLLFLERLREQHGSADELMVACGADAATLARLRTRLVVPG